MDDLTARFVEQAGRRFYGKYRGIVEHRADPLQVGRLRVRVPSLLADAVTGWAWPVTPYAGNGFGFLFVPQIGDLVWVEFEEGDLDHPIWTGCLWARPGDTPEIPSEARGDYPDTAVLRTKAGNEVVFSDKGGSETITVRSPGGCEIELDGAGKRVTVRAAEVVIRGDAGAVQELATKSFVQNVFGTHTHPTGVGPSSTPTPQPPVPDAVTGVLKAE